MAVNMHRALGAQLGEKRGRTSAEDAYRDKLAREACARCQVCKYERLCKSGTMCAYNEVGKPNKRVLNELAKALVN